MKLWQWRPQPPAPSDKVTVERVTFKNRIHIDVAGDLYMPKNMDKSKKYPAIVVGHTFTGVKEQTSGLHAQKLAELGYITLAFDASFWGDSGGQPRNIEVPEIRKELFVVPGASHVDLYDKPEALSVSIPKLDTFFKNNLK